jgi:hypothetical protein
MKDPNLRRCSRAARGMWIDMLCLFFECEDRGVLSTGGVPWSDEDIAAATGGDIAEGLDALAELLRKGVARRNEFGAIYSRRMVRDEQIRLERVKAGSRGGSKTQAKLKQQAKQNSRSSSSHNPSGIVSSSSNSDTPPQPPAPNGDAVVGVRSKFSLEECRRYAEHLKATGGGITNPGGYATTIHRSGDADSLIEAFLNPARAPDLSQCPDCKGSGFVYPQGIEKGVVARCKHERLKKTGAQE